jgi:putative salt-induced outer membrane protein YdiY
MTNTPIAVAFRGALRSRQAFSRCIVARAAGVTALLFAHAGAVAGQTPAPAPEPPPRLEASAQFAFLDTRGNASSQSIGGGGEMTWRPDPWTYSGKALFAQTESDGELDARSFAGLLRVARTVNKKWSAYSQYDFLRDVFAGVEQRHVIEGGISYQATEPEPHSLRLDAGLGYLYEGEPEGHFDSATLSAAAAYKLTMSATSSLSFAPRFLLPLGGSDAWKFDQDVALTVALNALLSLKLTHTLRYSAEPPPGFDTTDTIMGISLVAKVRRP